MQPITNQKFKIAIIGSRQEILCFKAVGVDIYPVKDSIQATEILYNIKKAHSNQEKTKDMDVLLNTPTKEELERKKSQRKKYAIVFIMEDILKEIPNEEMKKLTAGALPAIIGLPGHQGATGYGEMKVRQLVEKAVGSDIFGE